jgi:hypothetical protein
MPIFGQDALMLQSPTGAAVALPELRAEERAEPRAPGGLGEFLLVGGITPLLYVLSWLLRTALGLDGAELAVGFTMFYGAYLLNDPHFTVTYILFYKDFRARALGPAFTGGQRLRYWLAGVLIPIALALWAALALTRHSAQLLGLLFQLMFLLVGWHYVKQGFGVLTVLSARRGVRFSTRERLAVLAHCYAGWAYAWASPFDPGREVEAKGVVYTTFAQPAGLEQIALFGFLASIVPLVVVLVQKWRREGALPLFTPLTAFLCSVWSWSIYSSVDPLLRYVIPALHSLQYLYMVWLLKRNEAREREAAPWFEASATVRLSALAASALGLGIVIFHAGPALLDHRHPAADALGATPYFAAIFAFVNIHHYFMDTVIWRRENPLTRYLRGSS